MPKASRIYYAVAVGRGGPAIYETWPECKAQTHKFPSVFKSFQWYDLALEWLVGQLTIRGQLNLCGAHLITQVQESPAACPSTSLQQDFSSNALPSTNTIEAGGEPILNEVPLSQTPSPMSSSPVEAKAETSAPNSAMKLSPDQQRVLNRVKSGHSVFFTGSAGTGKSVLLRAIINALERSDSPELLGVTASTGVASLNIGGRTLHSWAGIGLGDEPAERYIGKFFGNKEFRQVRKRWQKVRTLIIDEVSMIDGSLFDKLETIAKALRYSEHPFGGIQLILSGDFYQLPPVSKRDKHGKQIDPIFAFDAATWNACVGPPVMLSRVFRQKDQDFADMLNAMRFGEVDDRTSRAFSELSRKVEYTDGIEPTELFPTRREVNFANNFRLSRLKTHGRFYDAVDTRGIDTDGKIITLGRMAHLLEQLVVPLRIHVKVGAQVMLVKNLVQGELVNGSVGQVKGFITAREALRHNVRLAGISEDEEDEEKIPRRDLLWPVVKFTNGREVVMIPQEFTMNNANGDVEARRDQVPLILAWALSVHKSQGQTLERVKVDLERTFEKGQAYVALSRATRMDQLQILNFDASKVEAHPRVIEWHNLKQPTVKNFNSEIIESSDDEDNVASTADEELNDLPSSDYDEPDAGFAMEMI